MTNRAGIKAIKSKKKDLIFDLSAKKIFFIKSVIFFPERNDQFIIIPYEKTSSVDVPLLMLIDLINWVPTLIMNIEAHLDKAD